MKLKYAHVRKLRPEELSRSFVYNQLSSVPVDPNARPTTETRRQADQLFNELDLKKTKTGKLSKRPEKQAYFQQVFHAAKQAVHEQGSLRYARKTKEIHLQVIDGAVKAKYFIEHRSPPGSPKTSRLVPLQPIAQQTERDPWKFDPNNMKQYVYLRKRHTEEEIPFDKSIHIAAETQARLELINAINSRWAITCEPLNAWRTDYTGPRRLRPVHCAYFTERWDWHGRLYTGKYGHQGLEKLERRTIRFDGERSAEYDYAAMHPRLLYHLLELPCAADPYALWGEKTTPAQRLLAKKLINTAINAPTRQATVSSCNQSMSTRTQEGQRKSGKSLEEARRLYQAARDTGLKFSAIYTLAQERHPRIADYFGSDYGLALMRMDSSLAIDILFHFAQAGCPCLSVHDSFVVPESQRTELKRVMDGFYYLRLGFLPVVK